MECAVERARFTSGQRHAPVHQLLCGPRDGGRARTCPPGLGVPGTQYEPGSRTGPSGDEVQHHVRPGVSDIHYYRHPITLAVPGGRLAELKCGKGTNDYVRWWFSLRLERERSSKSTVMGHALKGDVLPIPLGMEHAQ